MAHGLRYYKELTHADGKVVRLELLQKDYAGASMEIGPVCQSLRLDIQGDTEIDAPIVKTSLSMTFVDAPDHVDAKTKKCGNWTEFYTNDATYWQVVVKAKNAGETDFRRVWGGYVTPDSYNEVLVYRGSVTIVARDNIGHLSDFPFDAVGNEDGMITLIELIREAWDKIESPMWLDDQAVANADWLMSEGAYAYDTYMNVSAFESKNWYDALESALYAYGLVMRYTGWNNVSFYSLRNMPRMGAYEVDDIDYREPVFEAGAERELTPAVKRIEEAVEYKLTDSKSAPMAKSIKFTGATSSIPYKYRDVLGDTTTKNADVWPIVNTSGFGWGNGTDRPPLYFNPSAYPCEQSIKDDAQSSIYLATNTDQSGASWYAQMFKGKRFSFTLSFGRLIMRDISIASKPTVFPIMLSSLTVKKVKVSIAATSNGVTSYLNEEGKWQTDGVILEIPIDEETMQASKTVFLDAFAQVTSLVLIGIHDITLGGREGQDWYDPSKGGGVYVAVKSLSFAEVQGDALCETNRVNTNYDATNNVILSREPKIAPALNDVLFPSIIQNGIFVKSGTQYLPAKLWNWGGQTPQQMAVYNHLQLLCYHAKPNNVLRGTIVNADVTDMQVIWMWHGAEHMFVSGSFNLLSGHIENAVLREFARYEDMWGLLDPADLPDVDGKSVTNAESGSASKSEGARNTINTEVYLGGGNIVLDDYMSDSSENGVMNRVIKAYVDNLWYLDENGNLVTDKQVVIKNNAIINADLSFVGNGEGGGGGLDESQLQDYLDLHKYITEDALSSYYTKAESDNRYLASSLLGSNTIIHSGNIGSYKAGDADKLDGINSTGFALIGGYPTTSTNNWNIQSGIYQTYAGTSDLPLNGVGNHVIHCNWDGNAANQLFLAYSKDLFSFRRKIGNVWQDWKTIAFTDSNVASATKLQTARTIWGQSFDGTSNVDGSFVTSSDSWTMMVNLSHEIISYQASGKYLNIGYSTAADNYSTYINGYNIYLRYGANATTGITLNSLGNVLIGTSTDSGYKLDVNGNARIQTSAIEYFTALRLTNPWYGGSGKKHTDILFESAVGYRGGIIRCTHTAVYGEFDSMNFGWSDGGYADSFNPYMSIQRGGNVAILNTLSVGGNITIQPVATSDVSLLFVTGNLNDGYYDYKIGKFTDKNSISGFGMAMANASAQWTKFLSLSTDGNYNVTSVNILTNLVVSGDFSFGSDMRFKDKIEDMGISIADIAKAPLFTYKWNDRDDDTIYLGSSAQYWEKIAPWLVSGSDFKSLNYATLGVAMGISLAKKTINHEERIKILEAEIKRLKREQYGN